MHLSHATGQASRDIITVEPLLPRLLHLFLSERATHLHVFFPRNNHWGSSSQVSATVIVGEELIVGEEEGPALGEEVGFLDNVGDSDGLVLGEVLG